MYYPAGMFQIQKTTMESRRKVSLLLTVFFFIMTFCFGLNFGVTKMLGEKLHNITNFVSTTISLITIFILHIPLKIMNADYLWYLINFFQYICYFLSIKTSKQNIWDFLRELHEMDEKITRVNSKYIGIFTWLYALVAYISKFVLTYIQCEMVFKEMCEFDYVPWYIYSALSFGVDLVSVVILVTNIYIYCSVRDLKDLFKKELSVQLLKKRYIAIADAVENVRPLYAKLYIFELVFELPKMMGLMYNVLSYYFQEEDIYASINEYLYASHTIAHITSSAAVMQMIRSQMEQIDLQLHHLLIDEPDSQKQQEISRVAAYMKVRKLWRPIAGVIPVDMRLPISALSICATYLIVLAQLTHIV